MAHGADADINEGNRYWVGQDLSYNVSENSSNAELRSNGDFKTELKITDDKIIINTTEYQEDEFTLIYNNSGVERKVNFTLEKLEFNPEFSNSSVNKQINQNINISYQDNRNNYNIDVSSNMSDKQLASVFEKNEDEVTNGNVSISSNLKTANFSEVPRGTYNFVFNVSDVDITKNEKIRVIDQKQNATVKFNKTVYESSRGSKVPITVKFNNTSVANVVIGNETVEYILNFTVKDTNNDDKVDIIFDSFNAGKNKPNDTIYVQDESDGRIKINRETDIDAYKIVGIDYPIVGYIDGDKTTYSEISISNSTVNGVSTYTIPSNQNINNVEEIKEITNKENKTIVMNDSLVIEADVGGIYSFFDEDTNLNKEPNELNGLYLNVFSQHPNGKRYVDLEDSEIYIDSENNKFYLIKRVTEEEFDIDNEYNIVLGLTENSPYVEKEGYEEDENEATTKIELKHRKTTFFNLNDNNQIQIVDDMVMPIKARTNSADGTRGKAVVKVTNSDKTEVFNYKVTAKDDKFVFFVGDELEAGDKFTVRILGETEVATGVVVNESDNYDTNTSNETINIYNNDTVKTGSKDNQNGIIESLISIFRYLA